MDRQNAFREQEMNMGIKVKKILTGTALIMSLCMFTACGNANKAADEADTNEENMTDNNAANDDNMEITQEKTIQMEIAHQATMRQIKM